MRRRATRWRFVGRVAGASRRRLGGMSRAALAGLATATATAALALAVGSGPGEAAGIGCAVKGDTIAGIARSKVIASRGATVVYRVRGHGADTWWACRAGARSRALIGRDDTFQQRNNEYGPTTTLSHLEIAGGWVIAVGETGADQFEGCTKYQQGPCQGPSDTLLAVDAGGAPGPSTLTQFTAATTDATGVGSSLTWKRIVLSRAGAVAWLLLRQWATPSGPAPLLMLYGCVMVEGATGPAPRSSSPPARSDRSRSIPRRCTSRARRSAGPRAASPSRRRSPRQRGGAPRSPPPSAVRQGPRTRPGHEGRS